MRAMVLGRAGPPDSQPLVLADVPVPEPGPGQVRIAVAACGVCRTDLHIVEGELAPGKPDLIPGHQAVGRVEAVGEGVQGFRVGDWAGSTWLRSACGVCGYCLYGRENLCDAARFTGLHADGGFAERMLLEASHAVRLPEGLDPPAAAPLLCAGIIGWRSLKLSGIRPGETLGLFGFGASAHLALQAALRLGCRVKVFTRGETHRRHALDLGADWAGPLDASGPEDLHAAVTFAPSGAVVLVALGRLRKGGTVAVNAVHMDPLPPIPYASLGGERCIRSVTNLTREDASEFLALAAERPFRVDVTPYPLEQANRALSDLKASAFPGAAVLRFA